LTAEVGCCRRRARRLHPLDGGHHLKYVDQRWAWGNSS
jgi:hypothetical protein